MKILLLGIASLFIIGFQIYNEPTTKFQGQASDGNFVHINTLTKNVIVSTDFAGIHSLKLKKCNIVEKATVVEAYEKGKLIAAVTKSGRAMYDPKWLNKKFIKKARLL